MEDGFYYGPAVYDLVDEFNDKLSELREDTSISTEEKELKQSKVCKEWENYNIEYWNHDGTMLRIGDGISKFCSRFNQS